MTIDLVGWVLGVLGLAAAGFEALRGRRLERQLERIETYVADLPLADTPEELLRRVTGVHRPPRRDPIPALFGEDSDPIKVANLIASLPQRERLIFTLRFYEPMTLEAIGRMLGLTPERVRQIEGAVIAKVRTALAEDAAPRND